jgi:hypothetical protein
MNFLGLIWGLISLFIFLSTVSSSSVWFIPYFSAHGVSLSPLLLGYYSIRISDLGWAQCLAGQGIYRLLIHVRKVNQWW